MRRGRRRKRGRRGKRRMRKEKKKEKKGCETQGFVHDINISHRYIHIQHRNT